MKFHPEYVRIVLNENFEDAKRLLLDPLLAIDEAHLVIRCAAEDYTEKFGALQKQLAEALA